MAGGQRGKKNGGERIAGWMVKGVGQITLRYSGGDCQGLKRVVG